MRFASNNPSTKLLLEPLHEETSATSPAPRERPNTHHQLLRHRTPQQLRDRIGIDNVGTPLERFGIVTKVPHVARPVLRLPRLAQTGLRRVHPCRAKVDDGGMQGSIEDVRDVRMRFRELVAGVLADFSRGGEEEAVELEQGDVGEQPEDVLDASQRARQR